MGQSASGLQLYGFENSQFDTSDSYRFGKHQIRQQSVLGLGRLSLAPEKTLNYEK